MYLTRRQRQVVDIVRSYTESTGYAPTLDEIRQRLGVRSLPTVYKHLKALVRAGAIRRRPYRARGIELAVEGEGQNVGVAGWRTIRVLHLKAVPPVEKAIQDNTFIIVLELPDGSIRVLSPAHEGTVEPLRGSQQP